MSQIRKIRRNADRLMNAAELTLVGAVQPNTQNTRLAIAGNTGRGLRRRAKQVIEQAACLFNPTKESPVFVPPTVHEVAMYGARKAAAAARTV